MLDHRKIRIALRKRLLAKDGFPEASKQAWENEAFTPPNPPALYVSEMYQPVTEVLVATNMLEGQGYMQYDVMYPKGSGTGAAQDLVKLIGDAFPASFQWEYDELAINIQKTQPLAEVAVDSAWKAMGVRVFLRVYAETPVL